MKIRVKMRNKIMLEVVNMMIMKMRSKNEVENNDVGED